MITPLFSAPDSFARRGLEQLFLVLDRVMPMNGSQKRDLAMACRDLSALLTTERDGLSRPYWTSPRLTSAYLRYFLPWNLVRLSALLPGLDFGRIPDEPLILDMGSGPAHASARAVALAPRSARPPRHAGGQRHHAAHSGTGPEHL